MKRNRTLSILLTLALLTALLAAGAVPAAAAEVSDLDAFTAALAAGGEVKLAADLTIPDKDGAVIPAGVTVTLDLCGHSLSGYEGEESCVLEVDGSLTLTDSVGGGAIRGAYVGVYVTGDGSFTMAGGEITGGDVGIYMDGGSAEMTGGIVRGMRRFYYEEDGEWFNGIAVALDAGRFTLSGGELADCEVDGICLMGSGSAEMTGGVISGCGFGVRLQGDDAAFTLSGGTIAENRKDGVAIFAGSAEMTGGEIADNGLDGVYLDADGCAFTLSGGSIHGATGERLDEDWYEGGACVELYGGSFTMTGGELYDALGGITAVDGSVAVSGGLIRDMFEIPSGIGRTGFGGTGLEADGGTASISGGEFRDLRREAVLIGLDAEGTVTGGSFIGCRRALRVCEGASLTLSGAPVFQDNTYDVTLDEYSLLGIGGPLTTAEPIWIWAEDLKESGSDNGPVLTSGLPGNGGAETFVSGIPLWYEVVIDENGEAALRYVPRFDDVHAGDWFSQSACYATAWELLPTENGLFEPQRIMTRAELSQTIWKYVWEEEAEAEVLFTDVPADAPYLGALRWAVANGLLPAEAIPFGPETYTTREQMAVICFDLAQYFGLEIPEGQSYALDFPDVGEVSEWALEPLGWAVQEEIVKGMDGGLNPQGLVTRAQCLTMLMRLSDCIWDYTWMGVID